ncbi:MAG: NADH-quinone oxidoreductase subunit [Pseudomonadota bacterium]|jgi:NADH-quinone oxidoreductase subunit L
MLESIWLLPLLPLAGFLILVLSAGRLSQTAVAVVGAGSVGLAFLVAALASLSFLQSGEPHFSLHLWTWMAAGDFVADFAFHIDGLTVVMMLVISGIGFLIHVYATGYMAGDPGYGRFFCYMNLFVASMLVLVMADNLVLLYLGWEGVGLCSYLLIGFWYENPDNGYAARKAFVVTRVGDTFMAIGLFLLFANLGTLNIQDLLVAAEEQWQPGSGIAVAVTLLLLGGAVGKSAQLPLQTWLPDAMAGPTPISALIHAATMVTAGVYLIARTHGLFELAPDVQMLVAWVGLATLLMAGFTALTQSDIKRVLAYSTISQIGYMFVGLGVGAWSAAIFHLMTHAFFKALLFLAAGSVILSLHHEQNIFKMGGLRKSLPVSFWSFVVGSAALTALPFTSGYFSKDEILLSALALGGAGTWIWLGGVLGAFLTAIYTFRLLFMVFFGPSAAHGDPHHPVHEVKGLNMTLPLVLLMIGALTAGYIHIPVDAVFAHGEVHEEHHVSTLIHGLMILVPLLGIGVAYLCFLARRIDVAKLTAGGIGAALHRFWFSGWGMDRLYDRVFVRPFLALARINHRDLVDQFYGAVVEIVATGNRLLVRTQTGQLRWYAVSVAGGLVIIIALGVLL